MGGGHFKVAAAVRAAGSVVVAAAMIAAAVHFGHQRTARLAPANASPISADPLAGELKRCQSIGFAAKDDAGCPAVWAENRRRFFTYGPAEDSLSTPVIDRKPAASSGGR